ncbi:glycoside hydrolase family 99-like domain-containing protein [Flavicella marina]|uniref:glycoside hydrolase family 99-like domain-containing protein n=1 Tax=Flavicella marina TaxID=1475951 RepID=UPI001264A76C|nr:glycoside hydrolase family 99-like domain-containing protein [Flavicella marina]
MFLKYLFFYLTCSLFISCNVKSQNEHPKVVVHYMGWYGEKSSSVDSLRHWKYGHANTPIIGQYDSHNKSTLYYHSLLTWAAGIDGIVINVKDSYDHKTMQLLFNVIDELHEISEDNFSLKYLLSYDDQGFDLQKPLDTTFRKMEDFRDNIVNRDHYMKYNNRPIFYSFDYPKKFLLPQDFRTVLDAVFTSEKPYLIWNTFGEGEDTKNFVDAYYPWVQPGGNWDKNGLNWGGDYLDYFYLSVNKFKKKYDFVSGGVWPGFDDRKNASWGGNRLISRQNGKVYDKTWDYVFNYQGKIPLKYVVVETWNDWNEGTEIEPSIENGYDYLIQTTTKTNSLKNKDLSTNEFKFKVAKNIYEAINELEKQGDFELSNTIKKSLSLYCSRRFVEANKMLKN